METLFWIGFIGAALAGLFASAIVGTIVRMRISASSMLLTRFFIC